MQELIDKAVDYLKQDKLILYPTDTIWGIGCDATSEKAVQKVYKLKRREDSKALIVLVSGLEMLSKYVDHIPKSALNLMSLTEKPLTIIYDQVEGLAENLKAADGSVAIRIPEYEVCKKLINGFGKPIISTSANISGFNAPGSYLDVMEEVREGVDYILAVDKERAGLPSMIVRVDEDGEIEVIRD